MSSNKKLAKKNIKHEKEKKSINGIKKRMTEILELPKEVVLNIPKITMLGDNDLLIENHKGIIEYDTVRIRINSGCGIIKIVGEKMMIKEITSEDVMIEGNIAAIEFLK